MNLLQFLYIQVHPNQVTHRTYRITPIKQDRSATRCFLCCWQGRLLTQVTPYALSFNIEQFTLDSSSWHQDSTLLLRILVLEMLQESLYTKLHSPLAKIC